MTIILFSLAVILGIGLTALAFRYSLTTISENEGLVQLLISAILTYFVFQALQIIYSVCRS